MTLLRYDLIMVWKIKNNMCPNNIDLQLSQNTYNGKVKAVLKPMPRKSGKLLTCYENSFIIKAAKLWNTLPQSISETSNLNVFRKKLDEFLKLFPDEPPVRGYFHQTKNSILNYPNLHESDPT